MTNKGKKIRDAALAAATESGDSTESVESSESIESDVSDPTAAESVVVPPFQPSPNGAA